MDKTTKLKEAIKFALAFALVYGIALKVNWLSPSWAGWSVVAIAATSGGGESLQKGFLRIWGTILASLVGIAIISLGHKIAGCLCYLTAGWLFFSTYKMLADKENDLIFGLLPAMLPWSSQLLAPLLPEVFILLCSGR